MNIKNNSLKKIMDYNSFIIPQSKLNIKSIKNKKVIFPKKNLGSFSKNVYPKLNNSKNERNNYKINQKLYKTAFNSRENSLSNSKTNINSGSISSSYKSNKSYIDSSTLFNSSMKIQKNKQYNKILNNDDNFDIDHLTIKGQEDWNIPRNFSKILTKSNNNSVKSSYNKGKYIKKESNQKLVFNNVGIHYHRAKNNRGVELDKKNSLHDKEINKLQNTIYTLLKKNSTLESEKAERDNKIEILEEKIKKLMNFIKEKNMANEDGEKEQLINKVNSLENTVEDLKSENKELKKEIGKKDKIILSLKSNQNKINLHHKNVSIGKKKEKNNQNNQKNGNKNNSNNENKLDKNDINKIKLISINPDSF